LRLDARLAILRWLTLVLLVTQAPAVGWAHAPAGKVSRVGVLGVTSAAGYSRQVEAMRQGFRNLGYIEGQNLILEYRWADGRYERLPTLAVELVALRPDVLITSGPGVRVLKEATATIPIVMAAAGDAVATGLVASLAQPGSNGTGSTFFGPELSAKRLELLKGAMPRLTRVGVLLNPDSRGYEVDLEKVRKAATTLNVELVEAPARGPKEFDDAFVLMVRRHAEGVVALSDSMLVANMRRLGELSVAKHLPGAGSDEWADGGGVLAYGVNFPALWGRAPYFVDKILKGTRPASIPVEQASKFSLVINLKTAKLMELQIPQSLLLRADQVIQ